MTNSAEKIKCPICGNEVSVVGEVETECSNCLSRISRSYNFNDTYEIIANEPDAERVFSSGFSDEKKKLIYMMWTMKKVGKIEKRVNFFYIVAIIGIIAGVAATVISLISSL